MVTAQQWGPPMWRMLHTLAQRLGRTPIVVQMNDERYIWISFIRLIEHVMPCARCRFHYHDYLQRHPAERSMGFTGDTLRNAATTWLHRLHNEVNTHNRKVIVPFEDLEGMYRLRHQSELQMDITELTPILNEAAQARLISGEGLRAFRAQLVRLRQTTG